MRGEKYFVYIISYLLRIFYFHFSYRNFHTERNLFLRKEVCIVRNCELLNVRKEPNTDSDIIKVINRDDEINIIKEDKGIMSADFYKTTDGYVMKKYIKIIQ